ncbi:MAG: hypothetical protein ACR2QH_15485 [Geminicoccaceae bacterium]
MIRVLLICLIVLASGTALLAQRLNDADRLWFTVAIEPDFVRSQGTYIGGEMVMHIRLMSPDAFQRLRLDLPDIDGARTETLVRPHIRQLSSLGAMGYSDSAGYSYEARLALVVERSGTIVIPPIRVTGISKPGEGRAFEFRRTFPEQAITVHPPSPDFDGDHWIVSKKAAMEESWSTDIASIQNGDTVRRRVVLSVAGVSADELPKLTLAADDGFRVLSTGTSTETEKTDEGFIARLEQSWDIYVETEDVFHIDGFRFPYWNPETARTDVASLPSQRVEPLPKDALALREQLRDEALAEHRAKSLGLLVLLSLPAAALLILLALVFWRALPSRADLSLWHASLNAETPRKFYGSFLAWGRRTFETPTIVDRQQVSALGTQATDHLDRLHKSVFGRREGIHQPKRTAAALIKASRRRATTEFISSITSKFSRFLFPH